MQREIYRDCPSNERGRPGEIEMNEENAQNTIGRWTAKSRRHRA